MKNNLYTGFERLFKSYLTKLFLILLFVSKSFSAPLNGQDLLDKKVSVSFNGETLTEVIKVFSNDFDIKFTYNSRDFNFKTKVFFSADQQPLGNVLENIFDPLGITFLKSK